MDVGDGLKRLAPLGIDLWLELRWFAAGIFAAAVYSLGFFIKFEMNRDRLFLWDGVKRVLNTSAIMPDFADILGGSLNGFLVLALATVALAGYHYAYHFQGSKSIYLMKRLPNGWELPRRCLGLPLLGIALGALSAGLLFVLYFAVYMVFTPSVCLTPHQWKKACRFLLGVKR